MNNTAHSITIEWTGKRFTSDADEKRGIDAARKILASGGTKAEASNALFTAMTRDFVSTVGVEFMTIIDGEEFA